MISAPAAPTVRQLVPFAALSATYFAHIGFFNPYLTLWLQHLGLPLVVISMLAAIQAVTREEGQISISQGIAHCAEIGI